MAITEMVLLKLTFTQDRQNDVLKCLKNTQVFYPQNASQVMSDDEKCLLEDEDIMMLYEQMNKIADRLEYQLDSDEISHQTLSKDCIHQILDHIEKKYLIIEESYQRLIYEQRECENTLKMLSYLEMKGVDVQKLRSCHFLTCRFGRLPRQRFQTLAHSRKYPFLFCSVYEDHDYIWGYYVVNHCFLDHVDYVFHALKFEDINIPSDDKKEYKIQDKIQILNEEILKNSQEKNMIKNKYEEDFKECYASICFLRELENQKKYIIDKINQYVLYGFMTRDDFENQSEDLLNRDGIFVKTMPVDMFKKNGIVPPQLVQNSKFVKPFENIISLQKDDLHDMSSSLAMFICTVSILFFGDLGIGALMILLGFMTYKKSRGQLILIIGIAMMLGGLLTGSVFYMYSLYTILKISPIFRVCDGLILSVAIISFFRRLKKEPADLKKINVLVGVCSVCTFIGCVYETCINQLFMPLVIIAFFIIVMMKSVNKNKKIK